MVIDDEDLNGYLMYPKVFLDYMGRHRMYGPVRTLPTRTFFYGMEQGEEISAEISPGKTLEIRMQAISETNDEGDVKVYFELNGQPRSVTVPNRMVKSTTAMRPKAEPNNPNHIGAPMPGVVATIGVKAGQQVRTGRPASHHRSYEDGNRHPRRTRCRDQGSACIAGGQNRREGSARRI